MGLEVIALIVGAAGAGVSAYGQAQAGKSADALAQYNAHQRGIEADQQMSSMRVQAEIAKQQAEGNFKLASAQAQARFANAKQLEDYALNQDAINRDNLRKRREDRAQMQGEQRAAIASSGVVESSGSPLDLLAETASRIQQEQEETHYGNELERRTIFREAELERLGGQFALAGATLDRNSGLASADLRSAAARAAGQSGRREAEIMRLTGAAKKNASAYAAAGTILSGATDAGAQIHQYKKS